MSEDKKQKDEYLPEWTPENPGNEFAARIKPGIKPDDDKIRQSTAEKERKTGKKKELTLTEHLAGILSNDRNILSKTITLIESNLPSHYQKAREVLKELPACDQKSLRIGITGVPGSGKSTLIEELGLFLIKQGHQVAVLAVDPSSTLSKGSILGDKTRMERLSGKRECYIRPSPSGGTLGGVTRKTRETISVCEAAGYDVILIETVGVGQSEITVRSMVDFFLVVMITGGGDELQGIKKGITEMADAVLVNKADGSNKIRAQAAKEEFSLALKYLPPATRGWQTRVITASALTGEGITRIWEIIKEFEKITRQSGVFLTRRKTQAFEWVLNIIENSLNEDFYNTEKIKNKLPEIREKVLKGKMLPTRAAQILLDYYIKK